MIKLQVRKNGDCASCGWYSEPINKIQVWLGKEEFFLAANFELCGFCCNELKKQPFQEPFIYETP